MVVNFPPAGPGVVGQKSRTTGCRVGRHGKPSSGMEERLLPMFSPNEKKAVCCSALARASALVRCRICVKAGSVSIRARAAISRSHGRSGLTPDKFSNKSEVLQISATRLAHVPDQPEVW